MSPVFRFRQFLRYALGLLISGSWLAGAGAESAHSRANLDLEDLRSLKSISGLALSADGWTVAYVLDGSLWLVSTSGSKPVRVGPGQFPVWSPDSTRIAYIASTAGEAQIWTVHRDTLVPQQLTRVAGGIDADPFSTWLPNDNGPIGHRWSPDSRRLAFVSQTASKTDPARVASQSAGPRSSDAPLVLDTSTPADWTLSGIFAHSDAVPGWAPAGTKSPVAAEGSGIPASKSSQIYVIDEATRSLEQLTASDGANFDPDWSPDGNAIVYLNSMQPLRAGPLAPKTLRIVDVRSHEVRDLNLEAADRRRPRWSFDGRWIAYLEGTTVGNNVVRVISPGGKNVRTLTTEHQEPYGYDWLASRDRLAINYIEGVALRISEVDLRSQALTFESVVASGVNLYLSASRSGAMAWQHSSGTMDGAITVKASPRSSPRTVLNLNPQIARWPLATQRVIRWSNSEGRTREGILLLPADPGGQKRVPLIVDGYPQQLDGFKGNPLAGNQAWTSLGFAVFFPNARAPHFSGFADPYDRETSRGPGGWGAAVDDVETGIAELDRLGVIDPGRIALHGFSNGGGVANYVATQSHRFRCVISVAAVLPDWAMSVFLETNSPVPKILDGRLPWSSATDYVEMSAVYHVDKVSAPVLLAVGDDDGHGTVLGAIEMYNALRKAGATVTLVRYPNQSHVFTGAALADFWSREMRFLEGCLRSKEPE